MDAHKELQRLKNVLQQNTDNLDIKGFKANVKSFLKRYQYALTSEETDEVQKLLAGIRRLDRPVATNYEFALFFVVSILMISLFGENFNNYRG